MDIISKANNDDRQYRKMSLMVKRDDLREKDQPGLRDVGSVMQPQIKPLKLIRQVAFLVYACPLQGFRPVGESLMYFFPLASRYFFLFAKGGKEGNYFLQSKSI